MKEAFWGVLIIILGLFGIVVINVFQNVTIENDRVYYVIKETTEAGAYDALDLTYYRLTGDLKIVEDKFVENLTRRFAENITLGDYTIIVQDINELPPKVSIKVRSGITSLQGEEFGIINRVDSIVEAKYSLNEVTKFLGITEKEWEEKTKDIYNSTNEGENICSSVINNDELECIPGDIQFDEFEEMKNVDLPNALCRGESLEENIDRKVTYKVCNCGKWESKTEKVVSIVTKKDNEWIYTWKFNKDGEIRDINEVINERIAIKQCTRSVGLMVPNNVSVITPKEVGDGKYYEPDNSSYVSCPSEGIRIPVGLKVVLHGSYDPKESVNRNLKWTVSSDAVLGISVTKDNPSKRCVLNENATNCISKASIVANNVGTTYVSVTATNLQGKEIPGQTSSCKVEVFDGNVDTLSCEDLTLQYGAEGRVDRSYSPKNATKTNFTWSLEDESIATIDDIGYVKSKKEGTTKIIMKSPNGKTATCTLKVMPKRQYLYKSGNQYTEITGGWSPTYNCTKQSYLKRCGCTWGSSTSMNVYICAEGDKYGNLVSKTKNKVDLSSYSKLVFEISYAQSGSGSTRKDFSPGSRVRDNLVGVLNSKGTDFIKYEPATSKKTVTVDISNITGLQYVGFITYSKGNGTVDYGFGPYDLPQDVWINVSEVYLE